MVKPIGNQVANISQNDKVSRAVRMKYQAKSEGPQAADAAKAEQGERKKPKFKTRKK